MDHRRWPNAAAASTRDLTIAGNLGQVGGAFTFTNQMGSGQTLMIGNSQTPGMTSTVLLPQTSPASVPINR